MAYASAKDLRDRYPERDLIQLTDEDGETLDCSRLTRALDDASAEIDGYLQGRYSLPLHQAPEHLALLACDIAMYRLQVLRPLGDIEDARARYEDALRYLRQVARGEVQLGLSEDGHAARQGAGPEMISPRRTFSRDQMRGF